MLEGIKREIANEWRQYKWQMIGLIMLVLTFVFALIQETGIGYLLCAVTLLIDLYLIYTKQSTITNWIRRQLPGWADKLVMVGLWGIIVYLTNWQVGLLYLIGTINGHLNWEK